MRQFQGVDSWRLGIALVLGSLGCGGEDPAAVGAEATAQGAAPGEGSKASAAPRAPEAGKGSIRRVEVAVIDSATLRLDMVLPGEVDGAKDATLAAALGGYVEKVFVSNGQQVKAGTILARIDASTHLARLEQAKVEHGAAERELARAKSMGDAVSAAALDAAESRYSAAMATLAAAKVAVDRAVIRAPFAGTVANVDIEIGEVAVPGAPILRLVQLNPVKVTVHVSDREVAALREGMEVQVTTGGESGFHHGVVAHINPAADPKTRAFQVEIQVPNPDAALKPGMIASVRVAQELPGDRVALPQDWIVTRIDGLGVFLEEQGAVRWQPVRLGQVVRDQVVVEEGVSRGARVVMNGHRELVEGDKVLVAREGVCCTNGRATFR